MGSPFSNRGQPHEPATSGVFLLRPPTPPFLAALGAFGARYDEEALPSHDLGHFRVRRFLVAATARVRALEVLRAAPVVEGLCVLPRRVRHVRVSVVNIALAAQQGEVLEPGQIGEAGVALGPHRLELLLEARLDAEPVRRHERLAREPLLLPSVGRRVLRRRAPAAGVGRHARLRRWEREAEETIVIRRRPAQALGLGDPLAELGPDEVQLLVKSLEVLLGIPHRVRQVVGFVVGQGRPHEVRAPLPHLEVPETLRVAQRRLPARPRLFEGDLGVLRHKVAQRRHVAVGGVEPVGQNLPRGRRRLGEVGGRPRHRQAWPACRRVEGRCRQGKEKCQGCTHHSSPVFAVAAVILYVNLLL
mmetsp:Transcript_15825/g.31604  ORF Transcript_15825/g.31604 Transcript_15825/m.31604 type:complete len:360 (-) Transcript_15825:50-1129(-)